MFNDELEWIIAINEVVASSVSISYFTYMYQADTGNTYDTKTVPFTPLRPRIHLLLEGVILAAGSEHLHCNLKLALWLQMTALFQS